MESTLDERSEEQVECLLERPKVRAFVQRTKGARHGRVNQEVVAGMVEAAGVGLRVQLLRGGATNWRPSHGGSTSRVGSASQELLGDVREGWGGTKIHSGAAQEGVRLQMDARSRASHLARRVGSDACLLFRITITLELFSSGASCGRLGWSFIVCSSRNLRDLCLQLR